MVDHGRRPMTIPGCANERQRGRLSANRCQAAAHQAEPGGRHRVRVLPGGQRGMPGALRLYFVSSLLMPGALCLYFIIRVVS
eukprot:460079-Prorocentrum_minimum.AAC.1